MPILKRRNHLFLLIVTGPEILDASPENSPFDGSRETVSFSSTRNARQPTVLSFRSIFH